MDSEAWAGLPAVTRQRTIASLCLAVLYIVVLPTLLWLASSKKRVFPQAMSGYLVFAFLDNLGTTMWKMALEQHGPSGNTLVDMYWVRMGTDIFGIVIVLVVTGLWLGYFRRSRRVKNTFTRPLRRLSEG